MQSKYIKILFFLFLGAIISCTNKPEFADEPTLAYIGLDGNTMTQGSLNSDFITLLFSLQDGDGDIGVADEETFLDLILIDSRTNDIYDRYKTPLIPMQGSNNGIEATVQLQVFTTCCLFPENIPPCSTPTQYPFDTLTLQLHMFDRAGNMSNIIETEQIILLCD